MNEEFLRLMHELQEAAERIERVKDGKALTPDKARTVRNYHTVAAMMQSVFVKPEPPR